MTLDYLIYAMISVGIFTVYMAAVHIFSPDRNKERLRARLGENYGQKEEGPPPLAKFCDATLRLFGIKNTLEKDETLLLMQAGFNSPYAATYYIFAQRVIQPILLIFAVLVMIGLIRLPAGAGLASKAMYVIVAMLALIGGVMGARLYISNARQRRQQILLRSFPEAMDLLLVCIESGLGMDAAIARVSRELKYAHPEVAYEMDRTRFELTLLNDRSQALENLGMRTQILPFKALISALIQTEKFGTSLVDTLRVLSDDLRTSRLLNGEQRAARIPVFITIPLIFCILPAFVIIILGPPILRVSQQGGIFGSATPDN